MNRLDFLLASSAAIAAPAAGSNVPYFDRIDGIEPIRADPDSLIRVTVCTRPFRPAGPRFDVERLASKTVFHNYGHGGSGWSLSWGSADVVLEKLLPQVQGEREIAVLGCGALGLTTAICAQRAGLQPTIYAKEQFPFVRSARATGTWTPDSRISLDSVAAPDFAALWERMARRSFALYQSYLGLPGNPVEWTDRYSFSNLTSEQLAAKAKSGNTHGFADYSDRIDDLFPARHDLFLRDGTKPYNVRRARAGLGMTFNIAGYSYTLLEEFKINGGNIVAREFSSPRDVALLTERLIVNCTGYGARSLWSDESIVPVRGQIGWLPPQEGVHYGMNIDDVIITARRDGIAVQPTPHGDDTGWNDDSEVPDRDAARAGVVALANFYRSAARTMTLRTMSVALVASVLLILCGASSRPAMAAAPPAAASTPPDATLPSIAEKTKGLERRDGFLPMYFDAKANKVWLEIPNAGRDLLYEVSLPSGLGSTDIGLDRGAIDGGRIVRFERYGPKVLLVQPNQSFRGDTSDAAQRDVVATSFASSVLYGFPVAAESADAVLIDATDFALSDPFDASDALKNAKQGAYRADPLRSAIVADYTKSFPDNTEITSLVTLTTAGDAGSTVGSIVPTPQSITIGERQSFVALPDPGFVPRRSDPRAGFFSTDYDDFAAPFEEPLQQRLIDRWRLIKSDPQAAISEPVKPIVYYVERGVPEPIRTAIMTGASWWNAAFESAGFKNAFRVELLPEGADPMDVRYNIIQWVHRSTRGYSIGNSVVDPRTGEILKANVTIGSLRDRQDYLIGEGLLSPYVRGDEKPAELSALALARIRQVAAHEVGHTLGLEHNFIINDEGRTSVMGYPQPLVRLTANGTIDVSNAYREGIGPWDRVAIAWGYSQFPPGTDEASRLRQILETARQRGLTLLTDQDADANANPDAHRWNNGTNAVSELSRMMRIRRVALARFGERTIRLHEPLATIEEALVPIYLYHRYQSFAAAASIGGESYRYALRGDDLEPAFAPVSAAEQRRALAAILATVSPGELALPRKLLRLIPPRPTDYYATPELFGRTTGIVFDALSPATTAAEMTFANVFAPDRCARLVAQHAVDANLPGLTEVLSTAGNAVFAKPSGDGYDREIARTVQRSFVASIVDLAGNAPSGQVRAESTYFLRELLGSLHENTMSDTAQKSHVRWLADQIERFLKRPYGSSDTVPSLAVPNGAPI